MRKINEIIVHCTATEPLFKIGVNDVRQWHLQRGFNDIGYHYLITLDGNIHVGRSISKVGAHCLGRNKNSIGICYVGGIIAGMPQDTRTNSQKVALSRLITTLCGIYPITKISGHNEYARKSCPCFNAGAEYSHLIKNLFNNEKEKCI